MIRWPIRSGVMSGPGRLRRSFIRSSGPWRCGTCRVRWGGCHHRIEIILVDPRFGPSSPYLLTDQGGCGRWRSRRSTGRRPAANRSLNRLPGAFGRRWRGSWQQLPRSIGEAKMAFSPLRHPFVSQRRLQSLLPPPRFPCQFGFGPTQLSAATKALDIGTYDRNLRHGNLP